MTIIHLLCWFKFDAVWLITRPFLSDTVYLFLTSQEEELKSEMNQDEAVNAFICQVFWLLTQVVVHYCFVAHYVFHSVQPK